jgi:hypothetical protein
MSSSFSIEALFTSYFLIQNFKFSWPELRYFEDLDALDDIYEYAPITTKALISDVDGCISAAK